MQNVELKKETYMVARIEERALFCGVCGHKIGTIKDGKIYLECQHRDGKNKCHVKNEVNCEEIR